MGGTTISTKAARLGDTYNLRKRKFKSKFDTNGEGSHVFKQPMS